tara:strand:+ start:4146 stop:4517 length:372 start_codon:yes stop_codon:yes gene_type:complete
MIYTPKFPLQQGDRTLFENTETTKRVILFHLKNLLLTSPGEKISDPNYGIGIRRYLFEPISSSLLNNVAKDIELGIKRYLSYINIDNIKVSSPDDSNKLVIKVAFSIPDANIFETLDLEISDI